MRIVRTLILFITINAILILFLSLFPLRAIDVTQKQGMPPFKDGLVNGAARTVSFKHKLIQTFKPGSDTISGLAFYATLPKKHTKRDFYMSIKKGAKTLKRITFQTKDVKPGLNIMYFRPIKLAKAEHKIEFSVGKGNRYFLLVWKANSDSYKKGALYVNDKQFNEDLIFNTYYSPSLLEVLSNRAKTNTPLANLQFTIPILELLLLVIAIGIYQTSNPLEKN